MTDYVAPMIVPAVPAEEESAALAAGPEPAAVTPAALTTGPEFLIPVPAGPELRECLMCGGSAPADRMFNAGYGWYCLTADYAACQRRQDAKITAARTPETTVEPAGPPA